MLLALLAAPARAQDLAAIARGQSASAVLGAWCSAHGLGPLLAHRERGPPSASKQVRRLLRAQPNERIAHRRVSLGCGGKVLSRAENWYLPSRLTPEMNRVLVRGETPFGEVVRPLGFHRTTISLAHRRIRAILTGTDGRPFSYVVEDYAPGASDVSPRTAVRVFPDWRGRPPPDWVRR
ncbi:MAG TPA: hypothetical protein VG166_07220 [Caulobacteraceae bacterium]|nr:hypothetical protein [Caulobacteraceae bacterium]